MNEYTFYCTEEQTKKALELGAPIKNEYIELICKSFFIYPTTEQMVNWLEEQEGITNIVIAKPSKWVFLIYNGIYYHSAGEGFNSRKEATLAAIDAALEYLSNNKK